VAELVDVVIQGLDRLCLAIDAAQEVDEIGRLCL
jgi:hypothetical protein